MIRAWGLTTARFENEMLEAGLKNGMYNKLKNWFNIEIHGIWKCKMRLKWNDVDGN